MSRYTAKQVFMFFKALLIESVLWFINSDEQFSIVFFNNLAKAKRIISLH